MSRCDRCNAPGASLTADDRILCPACDPLAPLYADEYRKVEAIAAAYPPHSPQDMADRYDLTDLDFDNDDDGGTA